MKRNVMNTTKVLIVTVILAALAISNLHACTIFVLTDNEEVLFCNNEDWSNPKTRIWFVPGGEGYLGCVYVGFDNGWGQGGLNTKGLAFDWVAGFKEKWEPKSDLKVARGNPSERMLETCTTVAEAINFYRTHKEPSFSRAKVFVTDSTGASVIIGAKDNQLEVEKSHISRGFGFGHKQLKIFLSNDPKPIIPDAINILKKCQQSGQYATKYANVFNLKSGDIYIFPDTNSNVPVKFNLKTELKKGEHYYDIPEIARQKDQPIKPLLNNMKRFVFDVLKPIPNSDPKTIRYIRKLIQDAMIGKMNPQDYTAEFWQVVEGIQDNLQAEFKSLGKLLSVTIVEYIPDNEQSSYRYIAEFEKGKILQHMVLNSKNKVVLVKTECYELNPTESGKN